MLKESQILKLFSQPIFKYKIENYEKLNEELLEFIYKLNKSDKVGVKKSNINGWHSKSFDLNDPNNIPNKFLNHISNNIKDVFKNYGWVYDPSKIKCSSMWAIINKKEILVGTSMVLYKASIHLELEELTL